MWIQKVSGGGVLALAYSPDGRMLFTKDGGGNVSKWDTQSRTGGRVMRPGGNHRYYGGFGLADRGRYLVAISDTIGVYNTATGQTFVIAANLMTAHNFPSYVIQPDPFAPRLLILHADGAIKSWELNSASSSSTLCAIGEFSEYPHFDLLPHGRALICGYPSNQVYQFDAATGTIIGRFTLNIPRQNFQAQLSPDGRTALLFDGHVIFIWDMVASRLNAGPIASYLPAAISAFHPTAPVFAAIDGQQHLTLFDLETGTPIRALDFSLGTQVQSIAFSPDGLTCAVGGSNKQFAVFDVDI
jgi:WD40 repeat protein